MRWNDWKAADQACSRHANLSRLCGQSERIMHGLILTPGHHAPDAMLARRRGAFVEATAFDAVGETLATGRDAIRTFLRSDIFENA